MDDGLHFPQLRIDVADRLSELTDSLIFVILSFLPMRDVVRTTLLSKRWRDLWATTPYLHFSNIDLTNIRIYKSFICNALAKWRAPKIIKFSISFFFELPPITDIHSWTHFAIGKEVEELCLDLTASRAYINSSADEYRAPQLLYSSSSITTLSLHYFELKIEDKVEWDRLKSLSIECQKSLSEDVMDQILSGAPKLEELILIFQEISENIIITSSSLKMLKIGRNRWSLGFETETNVEMRIWAPNLLTLETLGCICCCLIHAPSLTSAILSFHECEDVEDYRHDLRFGMFSQVFRSIRHVEKLTLSSLCIEV